MNMMDIYWGELKYDNPRSMHQFEGSSRTALGKILLQVREDPEMREQYMGWLPGNGGIDFWRYGKCTCYLNEDTLMRMDADERRAHVERIGISMGA